MKSSLKYVAGSFAWSTIAKILNAGMRFVSIPLLLKYFGKDLYGLITLALATNAYMKLLNAGTNIGAIKFFSGWIAGKEYGKIDRVARTNLTVYLGLGIVNAIILLALAWRGEHIFNITNDQFHTFRYMLFILAGLGIVNWTTFVFNQLLIAGEKIAFTQRVLALRNIANLVIVLLTIHFGWSIIKYFFMDSMANMLVVVPYYWLTKRKKLMRSLKLGFYWKEFSVILKYSLAIFAMGLFQYTATQSRPIVLGMFSDQGTSILSDYRVIEVFPLFLISIGGMSISILLPKTSQAVYNKDRVLIERIAYEGTKYTSILVALICFPVILVSKELLTLYVGADYGNLANWLIIWVFTLTLTLHNSPASSLVLATGKTRMLVYSSAIACVISIVINALYCKELGVGSAVIGYLVYILIQMAFNYLYFNNRILHLNSFIIFKSFILPELLGIGVTLLIYYSDFNMGSLIYTVALKVVTWVVVYVLLITVVFQIVDIKILMSSLRNRKRV